MIMLTLVIIFMGSMSRVLSDNKIASLPEKFLASNSQLTYLFAIVRVRVRVRVRAMVRARVRARVRVRARDRVGSNQVSP